MEVAESRIVNIRKFVLEIRLRYGMAQEGSRCHIWQILADILEKLKDLGAYLRRSFLRKWNGMRMNALDDDEKKRA